MTDTDLRIAECIDHKRSFVLDAGAGSGKTTSLVAALQRAVEQLGTDLGRRGQRIACITYTNVAKEEIIDGIKGSPVVRVSTLHDFLWNVLSSHQRALKRALLKWNDGLKIDSRRKCDAAELADALLKVAVTYSDTGPKFVEGRLFHDDLLGVAKIMFAESALLGQIVATQYPCILVDEYQDASPEVVDLLLDGIVAKNASRTVVGFFGDKMQSIYDSGVGELPARHLSQLTQIVKSDNFRCSMNVIRVLNRLRTDIQQTPGPDNRQLPGDAIYVRVADATGDVMGRVRSFAQKSRGWSPNPVTERELYLTHRLISQKGGYDGLLSTFQTRGDWYRERLLSGEEPRIAFLLEKVEPLAIAWAEKRVGAAISRLRDAGFTLSAQRTKRAAAEALDHLVALRSTGTVKEVLAHVRAAELLPLPDDIRDRLAGQVQVVGDSDEAKDREELDAAFYNSYFSLPYQEVTSFVAFFESHTPYSTQHGVKGAQFDTVYVVLDDKGARWNAYSFEKYLTREDETKLPRRYAKTRNIFYVCCSRAMRNLAVVDVGGASATKDAAVRALFGADRCFVL